MLSLSELSIKETLFLQYNQIIICDYKKQYTILSSINKIYRTMYLLSKTIS